MTPNDPGDGDDGANGNQNFPVITSVVVGDGGTTINGTLNSSGGEYRIELFSNSGVAPCDPAAEGETFLDFVNVTTDGDGNASFTKTVSTKLSADQVITATATDSANNTSEFSQCVAPIPGATIVVRKVTDPATDTTTSFSFTAGGGLDPVSFNLKNGEPQTYSNLVPGSGYSVAETVPTGWDLTNATCGDGSPVSNIDLGAGETVTCTFTNSERGMVTVPKTVSGSPISSLLPPEQQSFTFQLRQGASTTNAGTLLEQADANVANGGVVNFASKLVANSPYQLCEIVMPGWRTTLGPSPFVLFNPSGDNSILCANFSVAPGEAKSIAVDNQPPPGGLARTIGFWKNWASCASSSGKQRPILDQTLAAAEPAGITVGTLTLHGSISSPNTAPDCLKAVRLLNKSTIDTGKKMASDPAFNLAAQLLAAELNVKAGALTCPSAISAINDAQALLASLHFNGITHDKLSAAQAAQANSLAMTLDRYNNNLLCSP